MVTQKHESGAHANGKQHHRRISRKKRTHPCGSVCAETQAFPHIHKAAENETANLSHQADHPDTLHFTEDIRTLELGPTMAHLAASRKKRRMSLMKISETKRATHADGSILVAQSAIYLFVSILPVFILCRMCRHWLQIPTRSPNL